MDSEIKKFGLSAALLLQQKTVLDTATYIRKMEALVTDLAQFTNSNDMNTPKQPDILEKMSFEIRTPMNSILGFTGLLKDSYFTIEEKDEFINLIEKNTEQLIDLLNDLTELTKIENLQINLRMEKFELNVFLLNLIAEFKNSIPDRDLKVMKSLPGSLSKDICIYTDPYQLYKIIDNLLHNMSQFNQGEDIQIKANILEENLLHMQISCQQIELPETISRSIKKHINPSQDTNTFDGTGLKLTVSKALIDLLNGEISFDSNENKGSIFDIKIPVKACKLK